MAFTFKTLRPLLREGSDADVGFTFALLAEGDRAVCQCEEGMVFTDTDVLTGIVYRAALTHDDVARFGELSAEELDAESFAFRFTTILGATYTFLMCHDEEF